MDVLGIDNFHIALTFGVINALCYYLPALLGDPVVPRMDYPGFTLTINYLSQYSIGNDRTHALIALDVNRPVIPDYGSTGLGRKLVESIPTAIKAGIVLGAGISAGINVLNARIPIAPYTVVVCIIIAYIFLFSEKFKSLADKSSFWATVRNQGIVPAQIFAIIFAPIIFKETSLPVIEWGFTPVHWGYVRDHYTIFGIGFPAAKFFAAALPMAFTAYIIAFSDFVLAKEIVDDATKVRPDELVDFDAGRSNLVSALRNGIMSVFTPWAPLCGPLWASGLLTITERYKRGYDTMRTYWGGVGTFRAATFIAVMLMPLVTLIKPAFGIFFGLTMAVQAYACSNISMKMAQTPNHRGIAGVMGTVMAIKGPTIGLATGIVLWLIVEGLGGGKKETPVTLEQDIRDPDRKGC